MKKLTFLCIVVGLLLIMAVPAMTQNQQRNNPLVKLETNMGEICIELFIEQAPKTVENFLNYVKSGHYDGTIFHRVINGFMIQGGGYDADFRERPTKPPIINEANNRLKNQAYTVAMARTDAPHSATSQFFINVKNNTQLDYSGENNFGYAVFGKVIRGQNVVNKIKAVSTTSRSMHDDVPVEPIVIIKASLIEE
jgi:cyclophilin family peptidyl-prolyl cis-trans isomerase